MLQMVLISLVMFLLVVLDDKCGSYEVWSDLENVDGIKIVFGGYYVFLRVVEFNFFNVEFVFLYGFDVQCVYFESDGEGVDVFIDIVEEGVVWMFFYLCFFVVVLRLVICMLVVYFIVKNNLLVLKVLNIWLFIEGEIGGISELEEYWVEGK